MNVSLRPLAEGDLGRLAAWRNDPRVHPFFFFDGRIDPDKQGAWLASVRRDDTRHFFAVEADGLFAGTLSLDRIDPRHRSGELGNVLVDPDRRGAGIARSAVEALLALAFDSAGLDRVELRVFPDNEPAVRLYEACGFRREGIERGAVVRDGRRRDVLRMAILRGDR
jgi:UDP-4-amino-4,6-dideoxy-N-acetyl-beta-L-altrosamine N-acetyltransferase